MENVSTITKILDYLSKPVNFSILVATFLISLVVYLLNFLPIEILETLKISNFLNNFSFVIFLILISSFFILLIQIVYFLGRIINKRVKVKRFKKLQKEVLEDEHCFGILKEMYKKHPQSVDYPIDNYCVKVLSQYGLIIMASRSGYMDFTGKQVFPYILQPETVKKLQKRFEG